MPTLGNTSTNCKANQLIRPDQNGGAPTLKVFNEDTGRLLTDNVSEKVTWNVTDKIRVTAIYGEIAVTQYMETGKNPLAEEECDDGSLIVHKEFDTDAQYQTYAAALDESDVTVTFGNKKIFFDPKDGKSSNSRTIEGVAAVLDARPDIADKEQVLATFRKQAQALVRNMETDGYLYIQPKNLGLK